MAIGNIKFSIFFWWFEAIEIKVTEVVEAAEVIEATEAPDAREITQYAKFKLKNSKN